MKFEKLLRRLWFCFLILCWSLDDKFTNHANHHVAADIEQCNSLGYLYGYTYMVYPFVIDATSSSCMLGHGVRYGDQSSNNGCNWSKLIHLVYILFDIYCYVR